MKSHEFKNHLKDIAIDVFGEDLSTSYLSKRMVARELILHIGQTNSGKTHTALMDLKSSKSGIYLAPLRLLALEKFEELNQSGIPCSLKTGEEHHEVQNARHTSSTVEAADFESSFEVAVIDECQMIADPLRGSAWTKAILGIQARRVHIIAAPHAENLLKKIFKHHHFCYEVMYHSRDTSLEMEQSNFVFPKDVKAGDALIVFSKRKVLSVAAKLLKNGHKVCVLYGSMPPETRRMQMAQYREGKADVLVSTDAIGMGLNLPIKRVVFLETEKFDGKSVRELNVSEIKQIAGRAGRRGIIECGLVNAAKNRKKIAKLLNTEAKPLSNAILPFPIEKIAFFPYQSFELLIKTWELYRPTLKDSPYDIISAEPIIVLYKKLSPYLITHGLAYLPLAKVVGYCSLPFSTRDVTLTSYWMQLIVQYEKGEIILFPLLKSSRKIDVLEKQYEQLSLYTCFIRFVHASFDEQTVLDKKQEIAATIFDKLSKNLKSFSKKCSSCGAELN
ncbi:helicase-related protein [Niallia sp. 03190]|uniref:helicase-related protein n=1 Tax=Niallia sp. 03190 TaxID=3458061 RepID=UPI0040442DBF